MLLIDVQEDPSAASRFANQYGIAFPVGLDTDGRVANAYKVSGIPTTFALDAKGRIVDSLIGAAAEEQLLGALDKAAVAGP